MLMPEKIFHSCRGARRNKWSETTNAMSSARRFFYHRFTTRKEGQGFGLHSAVNAVRELGGALTTFSEGKGHGATFTLELPVRRRKE
jgi:sensor histidine kinase regulating citrate/malate metabolism